MDLEKPAPDPDVRTGALDLRGMEPGATSFSIPAVAEARNRLDPDVRTGPLVEHPRDAGERGRFPCRRVTKERSRIDPDVRIGAPGRAFPG